MVTKSMIYELRYMFEHGLFAGEIGELPSPRNGTASLGGHGPCVVKNAQAGSSADLDQNAVPTVDVYG